MAVDQIDKAFDEFLSSMIPGRFEMREIVNNNFLLAIHQNESNVAPEPSYDVKGIHIALDHIVDFPPVNTNSINPDRWRVRYGIGMVGEFIFVPWMRYQVSR